MQSLREHLDHITERVKPVAKGLRQAADLGGFAHPNSYNAITLRRLIAEMQEDLVRLEANTPTDLVEARRAA